eukprot:CAMPEP_0194347528 /NCGR_PEP_ID=MMETSP0171-20130528/106036_1 /TAXON_ID=218684 /ORGANISM="Corethron pennatum, Strain L29A3" /LENGTH=711 /DNA_ID=CAMNT_0039114787 /DNA_START=372 /DNA_END=2508 /DNA_ORIENTATION=-
MYSKLKVQLKLSLQIQQRIPLIPKTHKENNVLQTQGPTKTITSDPTTNPTDSPTKKLTNLPTTGVPSSFPTDASSRNPTESPTRASTEFPTKKTTDSPIKEKTEFPTENATNSPTVTRTNSPTINPTELASNGRTGLPTQTLTESPTKVISVLPPISSSPTTTPDPCPELGMRFSKEYVERLNEIYGEVSDLNTFDGSDDTALVDRIDALNFILGESLCADPARMIQRYISALFYFATDGENWILNSGWLSLAHECEWEGIVCTDEKIITRINLDGNALAGTLPGEVCGLPLLNRIDLDSNFMEGTIPAKIGKCQNLRNFDMDNNNIIGSIPNSLFNITLLKALDMDSNGLTGTISSKFSNFLNLEHLSLYNNQFTGTIPQAISSLKNLRIAYFDNNNLVGSMPSQICRNRENPGILEQLTADCLGKIPKVICENNCCVNCFDASEEIIEMGIRLSGADAVTTKNTPQEQAIAWLIEDTQSSQNADFSICGLQQRYVAALLYFSLGGEQWITDANFLSSSNECYWHIQGEEEKKGLQCDVTNDGLCISRILLGSNEMTGSFPSEIINLLHIVIIEMDKNRIYGTIPVDIGTRLPLLNEVNIDVNMLSGQFPKSLFKLQDLRVIDLDQNKLTGDIDGLAEATNLKHFSVYNNRLSGNIPNLEALTQLEIVYLDGNNFTGSIEDSLCNNFFFNGGTILEFIVDCDIPCSCCVC